MHYQDKSKLLLEHCGQQKRILLSSTPSFVFALSKTFFVILILVQAMAEQGHTRSLSSKLNLKMNWYGQLGPSVEKLGLHKNRVDI